MRMHIELEDELVRRIDRVAGPRGRSRFVRQAVERALDRQNRWDLFESVVGSIADEGHEWSDDPSAWVRRQRFADPKRVG